jgi:hypothetical protein
MFDGRVAQEQASTLLMKRDFRRAEIGVVAQRGWPSFI